jgi:hypothetical protein
VQGRKYYLLSFKSMFRVTQKSIAQGMTRLKGHAYNAFATGRHWAGMLDRAVDIGRRAYGVVKPLLDQSSLGSKVGVNVQKGLMDYDRIRGDVLDKFDKTHSLLGSLKKAVPEVMF